MVPISSCCQPCGNEWFSLHHTGKIIVPEPYPLKRWMWVGWVNNNPFLNVCLITQRPSCLKLCLLICFCSVYPFGIASPLFLPVLYENIYYILLLTPPLKKVKKSPNLRIFFETKTSSIELCSWSVTNQINNSSIYQNYVAQYR